MLLKADKISSRRFLIAMLRTLSLAGLLIGLPLCGQTALPAQTPAPAQVVEKPSISLTPAVVMGKGSFGQTLAQTLTLTNNTGADLGFNLVAEDIVVKDGKRVFVPAGELADSIAASAVFSPKAVFVRGHTS